jgi:hypothetical protein
MGCRVAILVVIQAIFATVFADVASADNDPISRAWALLNPNEPVAAAESCASYEKTPNNAVGNLMVFAAHGGWNLTAATLRKKQSVKLISQAIIFSHRIEVNKKRNRRFVTFLVTLTDHFDKPRNGME